MKKHLLVLLADRLANNELWALAPFTEGKTWLTGQLLRAKERDFQWLMLFMGPERERCLNQYSWGRESSGTWVTMSPFSLRSFWGPGFQENWQRLWEHMPKEIEDITFLPLNTIIPEQGPWMSWCGEYHKNGKALFSESENGQITIKKNLIENYQFKQFSELTEFARNCGQMGKEKFVQLNTFKELQDWKSENL